jgi:hypothetical protein
LVASDRRDICDQTVFISVGPIAIPVAMAIAIRGYCHVTGKNPHLAAFVVYSQ